MVAVLVADVVALEHDASFELIVLVAVQQLSALLRTNADETSEVNRSAAGTSLRCY